MIDDLAELDLPEQEALRLPGLGGVRDRIGMWRALLDRPLTSYYLVLGITVLLLVLGLVMVQSTASVADLAAGLSPYSDSKKQLLGTAVGLPLMWVAARSSPRLFRAFAYPLLAVSVVGLCLTLIHGVGVSQNGASRWISLGGQQVQPSEIAKLALAVWGADLLARKEKLGQLADWRHMLVPLMPGAGVLCLLVMSGDDLGTTFILLVIFLALLWVIGTPGRIFTGVLILMTLAMLLMIVSAKYRFERLVGYLEPQGSATGANMQSIQGKYAVGSGGWFGVGLGASGGKWGWVPESTTDFIFAIIGEELGLVGTLCVTFLYGGLAFAGVDEELLQAYSQAAYFVPIFSRISKISPAEKEKFLSDHSDLLFPRLFRNAVEEASVRSGMWPSYIFSIMRQESSFDPLSVSGANAYGLLQLLPNIAASLAPKAGLSYSRPEDLLDPTTNIILGAQHLRNYWEEFDGHSRGYSGKGRRRQAGSGRARLYDT